MDDVFAKNSIRPNDQLLVSGPAMEDAERRRQESSDEAWRLDENLEVRREAEGMLHYLLVQSDKVALLIEDQWLPGMVPCNFVHERLFAEVAETGGCVIHRLSIPEDDGVRHLLFLARKQDVSDRDCLECLPDRVAE